MRTGINLPFNLFLKLVSYEEISKFNSMNAICVNSKNTAQVELQDLLIPLGDRSLVKRQDVVSVIKKIKKELGFTAVIDNINNISRKDWIIRVKVCETEGLG